MLTTIQAVTSGIISRRPMFRNRAVADSAIDGLVDAEEADLLTLAQCHICGRAALVAKAAALSATLFVTAGGPASPGEWALLTSLLADLTD